MSLFKDGKKYLEYAYEGDSGEKELERDVIENAKLFFGRDAILIEAKKKIKNKSLGNAIPDGFLFDLARIDDPDFYLVEIELAKHDFYRHIFPQLTRFFAYFTKKKDELIDQIYTFVNETKDVKKEFTKRLGDRELFKFIKDTIDNSQNILLIIDGEKGELPEIMETYTDTWGKMVRLLILKKFVTGKEEVFTLNPDFESIEYPVSLEQEEEEPVEYTEEFHLEGVSDEVKAAYRRLKEYLFKLNDEIEFNPRKYYIALKYQKNIAYFIFRKKKIRFVVLQDETEVRDKLKHHTVVHIGEGEQKFWGTASCVVIVESDENLDEIVGLISSSLAKVPETA